MPNNGVLSVEVQPVFGPGGAASSIDYVLDAPSSLGAELHSASGSIDVNGLQGPVQIETASGAIHMSNLAGDVRARSTSGAIDGASISRLVDAHSMSGAIDVSGNFGTDAQVGSVSGEVTLRFTPAASVRIEASSLSGDISTAGFGFAGQVSGGHALSGNVGTGATTVTVRTTSGAIRLRRAD
jgi:DUF4097 and DUF4098 domain-containing protein YvlB